MYSSCIYLSSRNKDALQRELEYCTLCYGQQNLTSSYLSLSSMTCLLKNWGGFFFRPRLWCGRCLGILETSVCVEGIDTRDSRASSKAKKAPNLFFLLPLAAIRWCDAHVGLFFSSYISLFGLSSFMSLDRLHSLRGSGFTISFCLGGNDKIIQGRIGWCLAHWDFKL